MLFYHVFELHRAEYPQYQNRNKSCRAKPVEDFMKIFADLP